MAPSGAGDRLFWVVLQWAAVGKGGGVAPIVESISPTQTSRGAEVNQTQAVAYAAFLCVDALAWLFAPALALTWLEPEDCGAAAGAFDVTSSSSSSSSSLVFDLMPFSML